MDHFFIQDFCSVLEKYAKDHSLMELVIKTNNLMSKSFDTIGVKEITAISCVRDSTLRKLFFFKPLGDFYEYRKMLSEGNMSTVLE